MTAAASHPLTAELTSPAAPAGRIWSSYQQAVFDAVASPGGHIVVEALAGSGKTSTIIEALYHTAESSSVLLVAFNKSISTELQERAPESVEVSTLHSYGLRQITRAMGKRPIEGRAASDRVKALMGDKWHLREQRTAVAKVISLAKATLTDHEDLEALDALADAYDIAVPKGSEDPAGRMRLWQVASRVLQECLEADDGPIDFDDMVWLPVVRRLPVRTFDWVFVDETQDLNACQLELVIKAAKGGRIVAVGDRRQAIYGFRGACSDAIPSMIRRLEARVLPLSITYRCPLAVVREAQRIVPALEPAPGAPEGIVRNAGMAELRRDAAPGDFVISRVNAPLLSLCWTWIAEGRRAEIRGRDIGAALAQWIRGTNARNVLALQKLIDDWSTRECARLLQADRDTTAVTDKAACLHALCEGAESVEAVLSKVDRIFGEGTGGGIILTSTHRAKGLEARRVWLLRDTYCKWPGPEEANLLYVAETRSKHELIYVYNNEESEQDNDDE